MAIREQLPSILTHLPSSKLMFGSQVSIHGTTAPNKQFCDVEIEFQAPLKQRTALLEVLREIISFI